MLSTARPSSRLAVAFVLALGTLLLSAGAVSAQVDDVDPYTEVGGDVTTPDVDDVAEGVPPGDEAVLGDVTQRQPTAERGALPFTGSEVLTLVLVGFALVGLGAVALTGSRRRQSVR